jgi:hypothetical protein
MLRRSRSTFGLGRRKMRRKMARRLLTLDNEVDRRYQQPLI